MSKRILEMIITGDAKGAVGAMKETEAATDSMGGKLAGAGKMAALGVATVGAVAVGVALKSASVFDSVGGDVAKLQRYTGASAEDASRLRNVFAEVGMDADTAGANLGKFSKFLVKSTDTMKDFGFQSRDAKGELLPLQDTLANAAEAFSHMENGPEKTALAMKLFGKSGADMIPILNKGKDGVKELMAETDKYGLVLSQDQVDATKKSKLAHREMGLAMQGVGVAIGTYVLPILTTIVRFFADNIPKALFIAKVWISDHRQQIHDFGEKAKAVFEWLKNFVIEQVFPRLVDAIKMAIAVIQDIIGFLQTHHEVLIGVAAAIATLLVAAFISWAIAAGTAAIATLAATWPLLAIVAVIVIVVAAVLWLYNNWDEVWAKIKEVASNVWDWIQKIVKAGIDFVVGAIMYQINFIQSIWDGFWHGVGNTISTVWNGIGSVISAVWNGVIGSIKSGINGAISLINTFIRFIDSLQIHIPSISVGPFSSPSFDWNGVGIGQIPYLHTGGYYTAPNGADEGLAMLKTGERVTPAGSSGDGLTIVVQGSLLLERDLLHLLDEAKRNGYRGPWGAIS